MKFVHSNCSYNPDSDLITETELICIKPRTLNSEYAEYECPTCFIKIKVYI